MLRLHSAGPPHHARAPGGTDCDQLNKIFDALIENSVKDSGVDATTVSPTTPALAFNNSMIPPT